MRKLIFILASVGIFVVCNGLIWQKERQMATSEVVFLRLAPVDPRSLIQGDYMALDYEVARKLGWKELQTLPRIGHLVVSIDARNIANFRRVADPQTKLSSQERLLRYKKVGRNLRVGPNGFFFQEGKAPAFEKAVFGEVFLSKEGGVILAGMRDKDLRRIGRPKHFE